MNLQEDGRIDKSGLSEKEKMFFDLSGKTNFKNREAIYRFMLKNTPDDLRFKVQNLICHEILGLLKCSMLILGTGSWYWYIYTYSLPCIDSYFILHGGTYRLVSNNTASLLMLTNFTREGKFILVGTPWNCSLLRKSSFIIRHNKVNP